jgi:hypothetical protein
VLEQRHGTLHLLDAFLFGSAAHTRRPDLGGDGTPSSAGPP